MIRACALLLIAALVLPGCSGGGGGTNTIPGPQWGRIRGDNLNTGVGTNLSENPGELRWRTDVGGRVATAPAIGVSGTIYVTTETTNGLPGGRLLALDSDGVILWQFPAQGSIAPIHSSPALDSLNNAYFGTDDGRVFAVDPDGALLWCFDTAAGLPCIEGRSPGAAVRTSPLIEFDVIENLTTAVIVGTDSGSIYAIGGQDGTRLWQFTASSGFSLSPAFDSSGVIYAPADAGPLYGLLLDGTASTFQFPRGSLARPALTPPLDNLGVIFQGFATLAGAEVVAINADQSEAWPARFPLRSLVAPFAQLISVFQLQARSELVVFDGDGDLFLLSQTTGMAAGLCVGGANDGEACEVTDDCPNGVCRPSIYSVEAPVVAGPLVGSDGSIVVATAPDDGSGAIIQSISRRTCDGGANQTEPCSRDSQCPGEATGCAPEAPDGQIVAVNWTLGNFCVGGDNNFLTCTGAEDCPGGTCQALGPVRSAPATDTQGVIYFGSDDGYFYAVGRR